MKRHSSIVSAAMAFAVAFGSILPASAAPLFSPVAPSVSSDVVQVQSRRYDRRRFERRNGQHYYNGHRGYREYRRGYRQYNGFWFPSAAFITGAIIGGAIAQPPRARAAGNAHVQWCYDRWRSYRAYDNSYQPNYGPRRVCVSPYR